MLNVDAAFRAMTLRARRLSFEAPSCHFAPPFFADFFLIFVGAMLLYAAVYLCRRFSSQAPKVADGFRF